MNFFKVEVWPSRKGRAPLISQPLLHSTSPPSEKAFACSHALGRRMPAPSSGGGSCESKSFFQSSTHMCIFFI